METLDEFSSDLDRIMQRDRRTFQNYLLLAGLVALMGASVLVAGFLIPSPTNPQNIQGLMVKAGGVLISTISTFPLKQSFENYERLGSVGMIKEKCVSVFSSNNPSESDIERLKKLIWTLYEKRGLV